MNERLVVVGAGHAAGQLVANLRQRRYEGRITLIGQERSLPYQRPPLSKKYLAGEIDAQRLLVKPASFYGEAGITVSTATRVDRIDRDEHLLTTADGEVIEWDKLVLATGAHPRPLNVDGATLPGVHYLRNIDDVDSIRADLGRADTLGIVGGGYIGLEVAAVAVGLGKSVTVIETLDRVMHRTVSPPVSTFYAEEHRQQGVDLRLSQRVTGIHGHAHAVAIEIGDGDMVPADLVVIGIGVVPNTELAARAGLEVADGIVVDDRCRTADPDVYAIGDCTSHPNPFLGRRIRLESVPNALEQARIVAANLCGEEARYSQVPWFWSDQYDLRLQIAGESGLGHETVTRGDPASRAFARLYADGCRLRGVEAVNRPRDFIQARALIDSGRDIDVGRAADEAVDLRDLADGT